MVACYNRSTAYVSVHRYHHTQLLLRLMSPYRRRLMPMMNMGYTHMHADAADAGGWQKPEASFASKLMKVGSRFYCGRIHHHRKQCLLGPYPMIKRRGGNPPAKQSPGTRTSISCITVRSLGEPTLGPSCTLWRGASTEAR